MAFRGDARHRDDRAAEDRRMTLVSCQTALLQAFMEGPSYGLELIERVSTKTDRRLRLLMGSVYPALASLNREGLIQLHARQDWQRRGRPSVCYVLTSKGWRVAEEARRTAALLFGLNQPGGVP